MNIKKLACLLVLLLGLTILVAACNREPEAPANTPAPATPAPETPAPGQPTPEPEVQGTGLNDPNVRPAGEYPIFIEPVTFTIGTQQNATVTSYEENYLTWHLEEVANASIEWEIFPSAGSDAIMAVAVRVAAGHPLPCVLMGFDFVPGTILYYGQGGVIHDLAPYFEHLAPNFNERAHLTMEGHEVLRRNITSADGGMYFVPRLNEELPAIFPQRMLINERMLHEIGWSDHDSALPWDKETMLTRYPTNTEELLYVLRAFQALDPANNIPIIGSTTHAQDAVSWIMNAFVYNHATAGDEHRLIQNNGVLNVAYVTEEWREGLRFLNQLYEERLLSGLGFTTQGNDLPALGGAGDRNRIGMAMVGGISAQWRDALSPNFNDGDDARVSEYRGMPNIAGPSGTGNIIFQAPMPNPFWIVTANAESPEGLFRLGDYQLSYSATMRSRYGPYGMSWSYFTDEPMYSEMGFPVHRFIDDDIHDRAWRTGQNIIYRFRNPGILLPYMAHAWRPAGAFNFWSSDGFAFTEEVLRTHMPTTNVPNLAPIFTVEEMEQIQHIVTILPDFVEQHLAQFITGQMCIENDWDAYLSALNGIGLPVFLQIAQDAFDRLMAL